MCLPLGKGEADWEANWQNLPPHSTHNKFDSEVFYKFGTFHRK